LEAGVVDLGAALLLLEMQPHQPQEWQKAVQLGPAAGDEQKFMVAHLMTSSIST
jgi:hypothetical protein